MTTSLRALVASSALLLAASFFAPADAANVIDGPVCAVYDAVKPRFFVRLDGSATVRVGVYSDASFTNLVVNTADVATDDAHGNTAIMEVPSSPALAYNTKYYYKVFIDNLGMSTGEVKTFRGPSDPNGFRFAMMSDLQDAERDQMQPAPAYSFVQAANPNLVLLIGDLDHRGPLTIAERRAMYHDTRTNATAEGDDFRLHLGPYFPIYYMWDNHDFGSRDKYFKDDQGSSHFEYRCAAWEAFREHWPTPPLPNPPAQPPCSGGGSEDGGFWYKFAYGKTHFIVLDCRSQKDPPAWNMATPTMLGATQLAWLKTQLLASRDAGASWIFLITSVSFDSLVKASPPFATELDPTRTGSGWGAFKRERNEIATFLTDNGICNAIWLSGDLHSGGSADDAHTGWQIYQGATGWGAPEFGAPHINLKNHPDNDKCRDDPDQGDSGLPRTTALGQPCIVDSTQDGTGVWTWGGVPTYVSGYSADDGAYKPQQDTYPDGGRGGAGYMLVDVASSRVTVRMYTHGGLLQTTGARSMEFALDYTTQCPRPPLPPLDPDQ